MAFPLMSLLVNPNAFFSRDSAEWEPLRIPALIVLAAAIMAGATAYLTTDLVAGIMPSDVQAYQGVMGIAGTIGAVVMTFLIWVVWSAVFFVISLFFQGQGTFRRILAVTGYGYLPILIGSVISLVIFWVFSSGIHVSPVTDVQEIQAAVMALMHQPVMILVSVLGIVFLLWAANIWIFGIRYARVISLRDAAITVGVPVALYVIATIWNLGVFT
jgi:hypothetical protein